jgi:hypothetical protein
MHSAFMSDYIAPNGGTIHKDYKTPLISLPIKGNNKEIKHIWYKDLAKKRG